jgi:hypothetical protein
MRRPVLILLPLCLALAPAALAAIKTPHFAIVTGPREHLTVADGKVVVAKPSRSDEENVASDRWLVAGGQIRCSSGRRLYLTYDPQDKEGKVFLAERPVKGAEWSVRKGEGKPKHAERAFVGSEWGFIEAGSGVMKGGRLDVEVGKDKGKGVRVLLRKEPKATVEVARLYTHK